MSLYSKDPKTGEPSVSLTILWISVVYLLTMGVLQAIGKIEETNVALEFFGVSSALYFGRRVNIGSRNFGADVQSNDGENK